MKELSIEGKAKAYDRAFKEAEKIHNFSSDIAEVKRMEQIFPELKENEDKRIRKELTEFLKKASGGFLDSTMHCKTFGKWLAWLENQDEQKPIEEYNITGISSKHADGKLGEMIKNMESANKVEPKDYRSIDPHFFKPTDKVEPKFKIGDIIRFKGNETLKGEAETHKIVGYDNELYVFADGTTDLFCEQDLYELVEQNPAWSEEDGIKLQRIIDFLWYNRKGDTDTIYQQEQDIAWLKTLRPQFTWKPSDEQLNNILDVLSFDNCTPKRRELLESLYNDLKKLRED